MSPDHITVGTYNWSTDMRLDINWSGYAELIASMIFMGINSSMYKVQPIEVAKPSLTHFYGNLMYSHTDPITKCK